MSLPCVRHRGDSSEPDFIGRGCYSLFLKPATVACPRPGLQPSIRSMNQLVSRVRSSVSQAASPAAQA